MRVPQRILSSPRLTPRWIETAAEDRAITLFWSVFLPIPPFAPTGQKAVVGACKQIFHCAPISLWGPFRCNAKKHSEHQLPKTGVGLLPKARWS